MLTEQTHAHTRPHPHTRTPLARTQCDTRVAPDGNGTRGGALAHPGSVPLELRAYGSFAALAFLHRLIFSLFPFPSSKASKVVGPLITGARSTAAAVWLAGN